MKLASALLLAAIVASSSTSAEAISMVRAEATLDWTGFTFTTTGTLSVTRIVVPFPPSGSTFTKTTPTTPEGSATASASVVNGFLAASAGAEATAPGFANVGQASASASSVFWFYGTGVGSLVVTVPYHLELTSVETDELDITSASANVSFFTGPTVGSNADWFALDNLSLTGAGTMSYDGVLSVSRPLFNPTFGPLVSLSAYADARASAAVPEADSALLLTLGLLAIGTVVYRRRNIQ